jgi:hypothetical protein
MLGGARQQDKSCVVREVVQEAKSMNRNLMRLYSLLNKTHFLTQKQSRRMEKERGVAS